MRRATPLGQGQNSPASEKPQQQPNATNAPNPNPTPAAPSVDDSDEKWARQFAVVRGSAPAESPRHPSGERRRRLTPARAVVQPSDPERLRKALEAMREMNKLTRRRTEEMKKLSTLSRELSEQMTAFGSVISGLRIGPQRRSVG